MLHVLEEKCRELSNDAFLSDAQKLVAKLDQKCTELSNKPSQATTEEISEEEHVSVLFRSGRSISTLQTASGGELMIDEEGGYLYCSVCVPEPKDEKRNRSGMFAYDFSLGSVFATRSVLPPRFKSLRDTVAKHFRSEGHKAMKKSRCASDEREDARDEANNTAAARVIRTAYLILKKSLSQLLFEELIVLQHLNDAFVGNINHSRMMMDTARTAICQTLLSNLKDHVESQPCVAVLADKVTIARRTVDITAIQTLVPNAEPDHIFQTFVVGAPVVKDHDGEALAADISNTLSAVGITKADKIAAVAADGQFHHNGVPQKLARRLESSTGCSIPAVWDQAHLMNLAESDVRKHASSKWVRDTIETVSEANKMFSIGKGWEDLRRCGEDMGEPVLRPKLWSETRFAAYAAEVFSVFRRNEKQLRAALQRKRRDETRSTHLKELEKLLVALKGKCLINPRR